jgi:hypothetical protein
MFYDPKNLAKERQKMTAWLGETYKVVLIPVFVANGFARRSQDQ